MTTQETKKRTNTSWSLERRQKARERILQNKPWEKSTGPKTERGKAHARLNALKTGNSSVLIPHVRLLLQKNKEFLTLHAHFIDEIRALSHFLKIKELKRQKKRTDRQS